MIFELSNEQHGNRWSESANCSVWKFAHRILLHSSFFYLNFFSDCVRVHNAVQLFFLLLANTWENLIARENSDRIHIIAMGHVFFSSSYQWSLTAILTWEELLIPTLERTNNRKLSPNKRGGYMTVIFPKLFFLNITYSWSDEAE